ncbi:MAG: L,D-transpeptidase family protein [Flavisolibacter sp.]|nr:L,D-transpeptidase family protein [Flavisolibacter sp.]
MKHIIIASIILSRLLACQNFSDFVGRGNSDSTAAKHTNTEIPLLERDISINESNAYSNLFLDSAALEKYIQQTRLDATTAQQMRNFYNVRNYQFAWFTTDGLTEQGKSFWNLYDYNRHDNDVPKEAKTFHNRMDTLLAEDTLMINATDSVSVQTELQLTEQFLQFTLNENNNLTMLQDFIPVKKQDPVQLADSMLNRQSDSQYMNHNKPYMLLREQLRKYYSIAQKGGWQPIPSGAKMIRKGASSPVVIAIKKRLRLTDDYTAADTSGLFNDSLAVALRSFQQRMGLRPDGVITDTLIQIMNIPAEQRIQQIIINMDRMVWMPTATTENRIEVNIPDFMLYVYEGSQKAFDMPVVVGSEGSSTTVFSGNLNQIVFSPSWTIPSSIVKEEILPAMKQDPNYLKKRNMEVVKQSDSLPVIRQLPGQDNALGKVKFLFPNSFDIYLHDTPKKDVFQQQQRAVSHGCIRLADAEKLAQYLLRNDPEWTPEKIRAAMNSGKEQPVRVKDPVPVMINYFTAWVDENGKLNFRNDIYGHDRKTAEKMFIAAGAIPNVFKTPGADSLRPKPDSL